MFPHASRLPFTGFPGRPFASPVLRAATLAHALALAAGFVPVSAQHFGSETGAASYQFLKLPLSPRVVGLGGAGAALVDDAGDLDLNPAAPASDSTRLVLGKGIPYREFRSGSSHITWSIPYRSSYRILLNARYLGFQDVPGFDELNRPTSAYGAHTLKAQGGMAGKYRELAWGVTLGYAQNNIASANYSTAMINAGARYRILPGFHAGLSAVNAGFWESRALEEGNQDPFPPAALQAGLSYVHAAGRDFQVAVALDARVRNDEDLAWPMGAEISWQDMIFLQVGYPLGETERGWDAAREGGWDGALRGLSAGLGLEWSAFRVNYAFQGHGNLSPGHFFSLGIGF